MVSTRRQSNPETAVDNADKTAAKPASKRGGRTSKKASKVEQDANPEVGSKREVDEVAAPVGENGVEQVEPPEKKARVEGQYDPAFQTGQ